MSEAQPLRSSDRTVLCRHCGHVFSRKFGACPKCGTPRPHKRPKRPLRAFQDRLEEQLSNLWRFVRRNRHYLIYVPMSVAVAVSLPMLISALAGRSPASGASKSAEANDPGMLEQIGSAIAAVGNGLLGLAMSLAAWIQRWIIDPIVDHPAVALMALVGAIVGIVLARRRSHRRHRHRRRLRSHRPDALGDTDAGAAGSAGEDRSGR
jgi:ribosomal protein L37E